MYCLFDLDFIKSDNFFQVTVTLKESAASSGVNPTKRKARGLPYSPFIH